VDLLFSGEKNGKRIGKRFCIVVRNVGGIKFGGRSREFSVSVFSLSFHPEASGAVSVFSVQLTFYQLPITHYYKK
jgi:hypothetical protein